MPTPYLGQWNGWRDESSAHEQQCFGINSFDEENAPGSEPGKELADDDFFR
jgi:hypothetical protein